MIDVSLGSWWDNGRKQNDFYKGPRVLPCELCKVQFLVKLAKG